MPPKQVLEQRAQGGKAVNIGRNVNSLLPGSRAGPSTSTVGIFNTSNLSKALNNANNILSVVNGNTKLSNLDKKLYNNLINKLKRVIPNRQKYIGNQYLIEEGKNRNPRNMTVSEFKRHVANLIRNEYIVKYENEKNGIRIGNGKIKKIIKQRNSSLISSKLKENENNTLNTKNIFIRRILKDAKTRPELLLLYEIIKNNVHSSIHTILEDIKVYNEFTRRFLNSVKGKGTTKKCEYTFGRKGKEGKDKEGVQFLLSLWLDTIHDYKRAKGSNMTKFPTFTQYLKMMNLNSQRIKQAIDNVLSNEENYPKMLKYVIDGNVVEIINATNGQKNITLINAGKLESTLKDNLSDFIGEYNLEYSQNVKEVKQQGRGVGTINKEFYMVFDQQSSGYITNKQLNNLETLATLTDPGRSQKDAPYAVKSEQNVARFLVSGNKGYMRFKNHYLFQQYNITLKIFDLIKNINIGLRHPKLDFSKKLLPKDMISPIYIKTNWLGDANNNFNYGSSAGSMKINNTTSILSKLLGDLNQGLTMSYNQPVNYYQATEDINHVYKIIMLSGEKTRVLTNVKYGSLYIVPKAHGKSKRRINRYQNNKSLTMTNQQKNTGTTTKDLKNILNILPETLTRNRNNYKALNVYLKNNSLNSRIKRKKLIEFLKNALVKQVEKYENGVKTQIQVYKEVFNRISQKKNLKQREKNKRKRSLLYIINYPNNQL